MKPQSLHSHEDTLLDFAYGELPPVEMRAVEDHLAGCVHCSQTLAQIRGVRSTMAQLREAPPPDDGLASLMAYAEQSARRAQAGPAPKPTWWRRLLIPVSAAAALCLVVVIGGRVAQMTQATATALSGQSEPRAAEKQALPSPSSSYGSSDDSQPLEKLAAVEQEREAEVEARADLPADNGLFARKGSVGSTTDWSNAGSGGGLGTGAKTKSYAEPDAPRRKAVPMKIGGSDALAEKRAGEKEAGPVAAAPLETNAVQAPPPPTHAAAEPLKHEQKKSQKADAPTLSLSGSAPRATSNSSAPMAQGADEDFYDSLSESTESRDSAKSVRRTQRTVSAPSPLSDAAWEAYRSGNRAEEARLLRLALAEGASGNDRAGLLNRLCDAEFALGRRAEAQQVCQTVLSEFPNSGAASAARKRLGSEAHPSAPLEPSGSAY